jgi:hypothetical protein
MFFNNNGRLNIQVIDFDGTVTSIDKGIIPVGIWHFSQAVDFQTGTTKVSFTLYNCGNVVKIKSDIPSDIQPGLISV